MTTPSAIFFDLDDTIVVYDATSEPVWHDVINRFSDNGKAYTYDVMHAAIDRAKTWYWADRERHRTGRQDLIGARRTIVRMAFDDLGLSDHALADRIADAFTNERELAVTPYPGAIATLERLKGRGVRMVLLTNGAGDKQREKIIRFDLAKYFELILIEGEMGYGKPDIRVYQRALKETGLSSDQVWMVGDNLEWDIAGAQRAGIYAIWNDWAKKGLPKDAPVKPDRIIHSIVELVDFPL